jgi:putative membrane protein
VAAVREVESVSGAEIVVAVRRTSGSYRDASLVVGLVFGVAALAVELFSPWPFSLEWMLVDPLLLGIVTGALSVHVPALRRWVTPAAERTRRVTVHARSLFVERGVGGTTGRTGVLVYVSLLERTAQVVADSGVTSAVPAAAWGGAVERIEHAARRMKATEVARAIAALAPTLTVHLPRSADDENELPDGVLGP